MENQNQSNQASKLIEEIQRTIPKESHALDVLKVLHFVLLSNQDQPKIGEWAFGFIDDQLKFNKLLKSDL